MLSPAVLMMPDFTVCTARSPRPLYAGWYGAEVTWTIPFFLMKVSNSSLMKLAALSETSTSGSPCCAKISLSLFTVAVDVVELVI